ncbi:MAG TPA: hypothetical protein VIQ31_17610, partial [Phormidium sp.]
PGGHASHKGSGNKPNTNANDVFVSAADDSVTPQDILREEAMNNQVHRAEEYVDFPPALERPEEEAALEGEQG